MKYVFSLVLILLVVITGCLTSSARANRSDQEWSEGVGMGYRGHITVRLRINGGNITDIEVDSIEDRFVGGAAIEELIDMIIEYNNTDVDVITGATETSKGFLSAVENAIISLRKEL